VSLETISKPYGEHRRTAADQRPCWRCGRSRRSPRRSDRPLVTIYGLAGLRRALRGTEKLVDIADASMNKRITSVEESCHHVVEELDGAEIAFIAGADPPSIERRLTPWRGDRCKARLPPLGDD